MTDKITIEEAIEILLGLYRVHITSDLDSARYVEKQNKAVEMAIEALKQNEKLKEFITKNYRAHESVDIEIDAVACENCPRNRADGTCPPSLNNMDCPQTDDEAIELFFKHGLE